MPKWKQSCRALSESADSGDIETADQKVEAAFAVPLGNRTSLCDKVAGNSLILSMKPGHIELIMMNMPKKTLVELRGKGIGWRSHCL